MSTDATIQFRGDKILFVPSPDGIVGSIAFSPRCCCGGCRIFYDDFWRTEIGPNWEVVSGGWSVSSGYLATSSNGACILAVPTNGRTQLTHAMFGSIGSGGATVDGMLMIFAYIDANNYHAIKLSGTAGRDEFIRVRGGVDTLLSVGSYTSGNVYWGPDGVAVRGGFYDRTAVPATARFGYGTRTLAAGATMEINGATLYWASDVAIYPTECERPQYCGYMVCNTPPPAEMTITVSGISCAELNGTFVLRKSCRDALPARPNWVESVGDLGGCQSRPCVWYYKFSSPLGPYTKPAYGYVGLWDHYYYHGWKSIAVSTSYGDGTLRTGFYVYLIGNFRRTEEEFPPNLDPTIGGSCGISISEDASVLWGAVSPLGDFRCNGLAFPSMECGGVVESRGTGCDFLAVTVDLAVPEA